MRRSRDGLAPEGNTIAPSPSTYGFDLWDGVVADAGVSRQGNSSEGLRVATYLGMASLTYSAVRCIGGAIAAIAAGDA